MKIMIHLLAVLLIWAVAANAQTTYTMESGEMTIAGTSTIHDWESTVNEVQVKGAFTMKNQQLLEIQGLTVTVPVLSIISGRGNMMDKKTWKALKSEEHPNVIYTLSEVTKVETTDEGQLLLLNGLVNIAGVERTVDLEVTGKTLDNGKMEFAGSKLLDMTDFDIEPPTALFGTLKTGKEITINFKVVMAEEVSIE